MAMVKIIQETRVLCFIWTLFVVITCTVQLEISPKFAGMFGGEILEVSGECFTPNETITCIFGNGHKTEKTTGFAINTIKARCPVPRLYQRGKVKVSVMRSKDSVARASSFIYIVSHTSMPKYVTLVKDSKTGSWNDMAPETLILTRNNTDELSKNPDAKVNTVLVGYREDAREVVWKNLSTLAENIPVKEKTYRFNPRNVSCGDSCDQFEVGYIEVVLANERDANKYRSFSSKLFPLGWFVNNFMVGKFGENWPEQKCMNWSEADKKNKDWFYQLLNCPCNLQQAVVDIGRFMPDSACNMFKKTNSSCSYHLPAVHCVRSIQPTSLGAGNQCCYKKDGSLKNAADSYEGSTADRSHDWGAYPYNRFEKVPSLSHWVQDIVPLYYCCLWTNHNKRYCDNYMELRPTKDCSGYKVPRTAMVYGQGHVTTLDNSKFRMCAKGDYILLQGPEFQIEGTFQFSDYGYPYANHSVILTNVTVKTKMETIEIRLRLPEEDRSTKLLNVLVNDEHQNFSGEELRWQEFKDASVVNTDQGNENTQSNFTIILKNGIGIQAADKQNIMFLSVFVPPALKNNVKGMLGNWDDNADNDPLSRISGTPEAPFTRDDEMQKFQYSWCVPRCHSKMQDNSINLCKDENFNLTTNESLCDENKECKLDLRITGDSTAALNTKQATAWFSTMQSYLEPVRSCGLLNIPRSKKSSYNYTLGSKIDITGCREGSLSGPTSYTCKSTGENTQRWYPSVSTSCQPPIEDANIGMIVGIIVAVVALIIVVVIIGYVLTKIRKKDKRDVSKRENKKYEAAYSKAK